MLLDVVVDDAVVAAVDDAVVIEVTIEITVGAGDLDVVVDDAVIAAVDQAVQVGVAGVGVLHEDRRGIDGLAGKEGGLAAGDAERLRGFADAEIGQAG